MVTVAVAGGTGSVGRTIVDALKDSPKHKVIVLARKAPETQDPNAQIFAVSYDDVDSIARILESNDVHTIISTIQVMSQESGAAEINLVKAAAKSKPTKRFIASEWGAPHPEGTSLPQYEFRNAVSAALRQTDLEWTRFYNGYFLDYYGLPHVKSYMVPMTFVVDMQHNVAALPGTGNDLVTWTYTGDVAKFAVAALNLPRWEEKTFVYGDKMSWNEFVKLAEDAKGSKFTVTYDDLEKLKRGEITELPSHTSAYQYIPKPFFQKLFAGFEQFMVEGLFDFPEDKVLNKKFPEIETMKAKAMLDLWKGK